MKKNLFALLIVAGAFTFYSCGGGETATEEPAEDTTATEEVVEEIETPASNLDSDDIRLWWEGELQISDFVWKGLNEVYYWQDSNRQDLFESFWSVSWNQNIWLVSQEFQDCGLTGSSYIPSLY